MNSIDIYVIYCKDERLHFMKSQLESFHLPYTITYFKAETPESCPSWLAKCPVDDKLQCCFKSHIEALKAWLRSNSSASNVLILEDDVCILKNDFSSKLQSVLQTYSEHPTIDYVSIGYLPKTISGDFLYSKLHDLKQNAGGLYWDFSNISYTVWGSQAQLFSKTVAQRIVDILDVQSAEDIYTKIPNFISMTGRTYQNKTVHVMIDALLPLLFSQAIAYPPLCIENRAPSTIHQDNSQRVDAWQQADTESLLCLRDYYSY